MAKVIHKGVELPFELPIEVPEIPEKYFEILPPLPPKVRKDALILTVDGETGELVYHYNPYYDY